MTRKWNSFLVFCVSLVPAFAVSNAAWAGAWNKKPGELELISTTTWAQADLGYDEQGDRTMPLALEKFETSLYAEYGLREKWTLVGRAAYQDVSLVRGASMDEANGFSASYVGVRRQAFAKGQWVSALQVGAYIPGATENGLDLRFGRGGIEPEIRGLIGRNYMLAGHKGFVDLQFARRFRSEFLADEWHGSIAFGLHAGQRQMWMLETFHAQSSGPYAPRARVLRQSKLRGSLVWRLAESRRIQFYAEAAVAGRNTVAESGFGIAFWQRFP